MNRIALGSAVASFAMLLLAGCREPVRESPITEFHMDLAPAINGVIELDFTDALEHGFIIPSPRQAAAGFDFSFKLRDPSGQGRRFAYKLYYQNEDYKWPETQGGAQHPLAHENFYGSWRDAHEGFRLTEPLGTEEIEVRDRITIMGDPREEDIYVVDGHRHREGRNPRTGTYGFMLVVLPADLLTSGVVPEAVQRIALYGDEGFINPFHWFRGGPGAALPEVYVQDAPEQLRVLARHDLRTGIHVERRSADQDTSAFDACCGSSPELEKNAHFEQFFHYIDPEARFNNIPVVADVQGGAFGPEEHDRAMAFLPSEHLLSVLPSVSDSPCTTVRCDTLEGFLELRNPAASYTDMRKESVGLQSRHALTYGRWRVRADLTRLLNAEDLWVGLTNAIWLIYDGGGPWAMRRTCEDRGYWAKAYGDQPERRVPRIDYAEIDFEILKTVPYCPDEVYPPTYMEALPAADHRNAWHRGVEEQLAEQRGMITVACTNWDMACPDPARFAAGCTPHTYEGMSFPAHRWDTTYRAITQKTLASEKELFDGPYWFEIDWRPDAITWRIGPTLDELRVVGHMDATLTAIPDVPMTLVVTQEWHSTRWWPGTPHDQGFIPFPEKDLVGRILEVVVE